MPKITGSAAQIAGDYFVKSFDQIAAVGVTDAIRVNGLANHTFQVTTADVDTNVIIRLEGSLDNSNWGNIAADGADETITTDGTTLFSRSNLPLEYVRVRFVSESGTTTPTVDVAYAGTR